MKRCVSCNKVVNSDKTEFRCPSCGKSNIVRCDACKNVIKTYTCTECGFIGP